MVRSYIELIEKNYKRMGDKCIHLQYTIQNNIRRFSKRLLINFKGIVSGLIPKILKKFFLKNYSNKIQLQFATSKIEIDP